VTAHPTCCGWRKGWFCQKLGTQKNTQGEGLGGTWGVLESLRFEQNRKRAVSHGGKCSKLFFGEKNKKSIPNFSKM